MAAVTPEIVGRNFEVTPDIRQLVESHGLTMPMMCYSSDFTKPAAADRADRAEQHFEGAVEVG